MVRRYVENRSNRGMKSLNRLKLKTGNFENVVAYILRAGDQICDWSPNIPAYLRGLSGFGENLAAERRGSGLSIGTGNGDDLPAQEARGQLDFADDRHLI